MDAPWNKLATSNRSFRVATVYCYTVYSVYVYTLTITDPGADIGQVYHNDTLGGAARWLR